MNHETIKCLERLKSSLEAAAQVSNHGKLETVEALRSGIQIGVDALNRELAYQLGKAAAPAAVTVPRRVPQPQMVERKCAWCKGPFMARAADVKRGWAKFCSKSCKASKQEKRTGQYRALQQRGDDEVECGHIFASGFFGHGQE